MSETHINAYFADVEIAKAKLVAAQGELEATEARLEAKKLEDGFEEPLAIEEPVEEVSEPEEEKPEEIVEETEKATE